MLFLVPSTDDSLGMLPVVYQPLRDTLDALDGRVQIPELLLDRCYGETTAGNATTAHLLPFTSHCSALALYCSTFVPFQVLLYVRVFRENNWAML